MPRNITVTLDNGEPLVFKNVPDDVTPEQITARVQQESPGANIVQIDGGRPSAPAAGAPAGEPAPEAEMPAMEEPAAPGEDVAGYERALGEYYQQLGETKGAFDPTVVQGLASKYGVGTISNLPAVEEFYNKYGTLNPRLSTISTMSEPPVAPKQDEIIGTVPQGGEWTQRARAFGKGFLFDFADELEASARMLASGQISSDEYYRIKNQLNDDYNAWAKANPGEALALEAAGGVGSLFIPGVGVLGRGVQAATGLSKLGSVGLRAAGSGALSGGLSGLGQAETMKPSDLLASTTSNALLGAVTAPVFAKGFEYTGRGLASAGQKLRERFGPGIEVMDDATGEFIRIPTKAVTPEELKASEMLYEAAGQQGPQRAVGEAALASKYGAPTPLGLSTPRMTALTEKVIQKPSAGQEALAEAVYSTRAGAADRIGERAKEALPGAKDYFGEEEAITQRLRDIGDTEYQRAYAVGEVRDPMITEVINNPSSTIRSIWQSAQNLAQLKGRDLRMRMDPVLDEGGNLVGLAPTNDAIPNVEALDLFKRALDDRIEAGFKGKSSEGKSEAAALKDIRNSLVTRLDQLVPEYREARTKYAGDMEVRDALRYGLDIFSRKVRPAEFRKEIAGMSEAEREAVKSGALEAMFRDIEGSQGRDLAKKISGTPEKLAKLKDIMGPAEAKFFERAMRRESDLYQRTAKVTGGSRTAPLGEGMRQLDEAIQGGNLDDAVTMLTAGPVGRMAMFARWVSNLNPRKEFGDKVYTTISKALASQKPEELREVLDMLRRSKSYAEQINRTKEMAAGPVAVVAGATIPSAVEDRSMQPPPFTERDMSEEEALAAEAEAIAGSAPEAGLAYGMGEMPVEEAASEELPEEGTVMMGDRAVVFDAPTGQYKDAVTGEIVSNFAEGGPVKMERGGSSTRDRARSFAKGATFAFNDEIEAGLRALAQLDPAAYRREVNRIRAQQQAYENANPIESLALEGAGSIVPAFIPGGQIASAGRLGSLAARAPMAVRRAAPVIRDAALYGAGSADSIRDIPRAMGEEAAVGLGLYGAGRIGGRLAARPAKAGYRKVRSIFR